MRLRDQLTIKQLEDSLEECKLSNQVTSQKLAKCKQKFKLEQQTSVKLQILLDR